ncbi:MAG TPA: glutamate-cysteine ligase family protein [Casimicrobiaceae bacterium]|nr:glutamate-cysteine ligase family protein [Casimicrobiaceae bacterium]
MNRLVLPAFAGVGIELEYMIVGGDTLDVRSLAAELLHDLGGVPASNVERGALGWSNELVQHVVELKNNLPSRTLDTLPQALQSEVRHVNRVLARRHARLMPSGMHPWMRPRHEARLWELDNAELYGTFDRIFDCRRHGWANLQSMHLNLPYAGDDEFARLHAAIRVVLPLIPALAASSPYADGHPTALLDYRLEVYRSNASRCPTITGEVIPASIESQEEYEAEVLAPMYREIAPLDPDGRLRHEWLNARGAIARFERNAIEIRLADTQECPRADVAVAAAIVAAVYALYQERWSSRAVQRDTPGALLVQILRDCIRDGEEAVVGSSGYLELFDFPGPSATARELWAHLIERMETPGIAAHAQVREPLEVILERGTLARRIMRATDGASGAEALRPVYAQLCECLATGAPFLA